MSYLALARKHRPQTFEEIVGQKHVCLTLQNAIRLDKVHHAFLFTGTRGVGKTTIARILAKALNCETGPTPTPCNVCQSCREITASASVDVLEIDGASNRGIDDVRELRDSVRYMPAGSRYRIIIIDEVHMLTREAFNALLKTLEEPPKHVKFIFATTDPHRLPETILSRVQRYDFRTIPAKAMHAYLTALVEKEGVSVSADNLTLIVRKARGSMRDALSLVDQAVSFGGDLSAEELSDLLGVTDWRQLFRLSESILAGDAGSCLELYETVFRSAHDTRQFFLDLLEHFRNLVVVRTVKDPAPLVNATPEELAELGRLSEKHGPEQLQMLFRMLVASEDEVLRSANPRLVLEMVVLAAATTRPVVGLDELLTRVGEMAGGAPPAPESARLARPPADPGPRPAAAPEAGPRVVSKGAADRLEELRAFVRSRNARIAGLLTPENVEPARISPKEVTLQSKTSFFYDTITRHGGFEPLQKAVREWLGDGASLNVLKPVAAADDAASSPVRDETRSEEERRRAARREAIESPGVQEVLDVFDGEIVEVQIKENKS